MSTRTMQGLPVLVREGSAMARGHKRVCSQDGLHSVSTALESTGPVSPHPGKLPTHHTRSISIHGLIDRSYKMPFAYVCC